MKKIRVEIKDGDLMRWRDEVIVRWRWRRVDDELDEYAVQWSEEEEGVTVLLMCFYNSYE